MSTSLDSQIRSRIDAFVNDLSSLVRRAALEAVQEALGSQAGAARSLGRGRTSARSAAALTSASGKRIRRSGAQVEAVGNRVLAFVKSNPGQRLEQIASSLNLPTKVLKLPVSKLVEGQQLKTKGQRRGTKYFTGSKA